MDSQKTHQTTEIDRLVIDVLVLQGFDPKEAEHAYLECGRDIFKASNMLQRNLEFNQKVRAHFDSLTRGIISDQALVNFGNEFKLIRNVHEELELGKQAAKIKNVDLERLKLVKQLGMSKKDAILNHLDELKWKPNQVDIEDVSEIYRSKLQKK